MGKDGQTRVSLGCKKSLPWGDKEYIMENTEGDPGAAVVRQKPSLH
jgi:hypothetical protein